MIERGRKLEEGVKLGREPVLGPQPLRRKRAWRKAGCLALGGRVGAVGCLTDGGAPGTTCLHLPSSGP